MPLTWQDVAGQVRAPDPSGLNQMITRGVATVGDAVAALGSAPDERRKLEAAKQMQMAQMAGAMAKEIGQQTNEYFKDKDARDEKKSMKQFGAAESSILAGARTAALHGIPFDEFLKSNPEYQGLDEGARAYGQSHAFEAYRAGDDTRMQQAQHAADQARDEQHFRMNYGLQARQLEISRQEHADARAEREAARKAAEALKPKVWKTGNDETDKAMTLLAQRTGTKYNEASGAAYDGVGITEVNKDYPNIGGANDVFDAYNRQRAKKHLPILPDGILKRLLDKNVGTTTDVPGENGWNSIDDKAIKKALDVMADEYDVAYKGKDFYERLGAYVDAGKRPTMKIVDDNFNSMFREALTPAPAPLPAMPTLGDVYARGGR